MSRFLSELLGAQEPAFTFGLRELETASGQPGIDVRLSSEMSQKTKQKIRELGLDPKDTTGKELYHALQGLVQLHDGFLAKALGAVDPSNVEDLLPRLKATAEKLPITKNCWVLKQSVARKLLKEMPPKHVMKQLGYKSVDSLLKRENIAELYAAVRFAESAAWQEKFIKSYKNITPSDFENREIQVLLLSEKRWNGLAEAFVMQNRHNVTAIKEMGVVAILPLPVKRLRGVSITILPLIIHAIQEVRMHSAYCKLQQVKPNFANFLMRELSGQTTSLAMMAGQPVYWRVLHHYFSGKGMDHPEIFEPHVQAEDLEWRRVEEILYKVEPALKFWEGMDYVGTNSSGKVVPFNLLDNAVSYCNDLPYGGHAAYHFRESLWNEIFVRYMGEEALEREVMGQLSEKLLVPEFDLAELGAL